MPESSAPLTYWASAGERQRQLHRLTETPTTWQQSEQPSRGRMGQFQFCETSSRRRRVNPKLAIRENMNPVGQITIGVFTQAFAGVDTGCVANGRRLTRGTYQPFHTMTERWTTTQRQTSKIIVWKFPNTVMSKPKVSSVPKVQLHFDVSNLHVFAAPCRGLHGYPRDSVPLEFDPQPWCPSCPTARS